MRLVKFYYDICNFFAYLSGFYSRYIAFGLDRHNIETMREIDVRPTTLTNSADKFLTCLLMLCDAGRMFYGLESVINSLRDATL